MFSVIIPIYNKSSYIENCLNSVLNQSLQDFEVIVVNDGSTDDSLIRVQNIVTKQFREECEKNQTPKKRDNSQWQHVVSVMEENEIQNSSLKRQCKINILNQANLGVSIARNVGAKASKYDYLAFLDADDWWDLTFLEHMKKLIEKFPDAGLYGCNYFYVKNKRKRKITQGLDEGFTDGYIDYFKTFSRTFSAPFNCSFVIVSKDMFFKAGEFNPTLKYGEDVDLWIRISLQNKVAYLNKPLAYSNQDVDKCFRAVGNSHLFEPKNHFIFNLEYLSKEEHLISELKFLLDGLRVRSLSKFYFNDKFSEKVSYELSKVNFFKQPLFYYFVFNSPKWILKTYLYSRKIGSVLKNYMIRILED